MPFDVSAKPRRPPSSGDSAPASREASRCSPACFGDGERRRGEPPGTACLWGASLGLSGARRRWQDLRAGRVPAPWAALGTHLPGCPLCRGAQGWQGEGRGGVLGRLRGPGYHQPRHALPHPRRRAQHIAPRCLDNGNSYTLLFILKDTCSYLSFAKPSKDCMPLRIPPR